MAVRLIPDGGEIMAHYFRQPWENRGSYTAHSPLTFVERATTPLFIQHGERDPRAPIAGAWKMYRALKALGKTVDLDVYPRGGHVMYEPMLQHEVMRGTSSGFEGGSRSGSCRTGSWRGEVPSDRDRSRVSGGIRDASAAFGMPSAGRGLSKISNIFEYT